MPGMMYKKGGVVKKYQEGGQVRRRRPQPAPRPRAAPPPRSPGMTEDEVLRDQSNRMQGTRDSMMREDDVPYYFGNAGMMDPRNFENAIKLREQRRTQPTRMKKGGTVKKKKAGGMIKGKK